MNKKQAAEIKKGRFEKPHDFRRMSPEMCAKVGCSAFSLFRIGVLDCCGRHSSWAITIQLENGATWKEPFVGRYYV